MFNQLDAQGLKCKECKFRCHTQCEAQVNLFAIVNIVAIIQPPLSSSVQVPPSCGLPAELLEIYWEHMKVSSFFSSKLSDTHHLPQGREGSPSLPRSSQPPDLTKAFESSSSSCNSSTPSSPQVGTKAFNLIQHSL